MISFDDINSSISNGSTKVYRDYNYDDYKI